MLRNLHAGYEEGSLWLVTSPLCRNEETDVRTASLVFSTISGECLCSLGWSVGMTDVCCSVRRHPRVTYAAIALGKRFDTW
jgi:hypothetical protein